MFAGKNLSKYAFNFCVLKSNIELPSRNGIIVMDHHHLFLNLYFCPKSLGNLDFEPSSSPGPAWSLQERVPGIQVLCCFVLFHILFIAQ